MKLAVVYCGGCNPQIDRLELVRKLSEILGRPVFSLKKVAQPEIVIAVSGCPVGCAGRDLEQKYGRRVVAVAGSTVDAWPVSARELPNVLVERVKEIERQMEGDIS